MKELEAPDRSGSFVPHNEHDPDCGRAPVSGPAAGSCEHQTTLSSGRVPLLLIHHLHQIDLQTSHLQGAVSDLQVHRARGPIKAVGQPFSSRPFPEMPHSMHEADPDLFISTLIA